MTHAAAANRLPRLALDATAAGLGAVTVFAFAPFHFAFVSVITLAGLFALWSRSTPRRAAWHGWLFGMGLFGAGCYWLFVSIHRFGGVPAWLAVLLTALLAAYLALYPMLVGYVATRWSQTRAAAWALLLLPALWTLSELARAWLFTGFPWLSIGYTWIDTPLRNLGPVLGVFGLSWVAVCAAGALYLIVYEAGTRLKAATVAGTALALGALALLPAPTYWTTATGKRLTIAMIQGNVAQNRKWAPGNRLPTQAKYLRLTRQAGNASVVIWPEAALPELLGNVPATYMDRLRGLLRRRGQTLVTGMLRRDGGNIYNSVVTIGGNTRARYDKRHLVPFGEYFPLPDFLVGGLNLLNLPHSDLTPGAAAQPPFRVAGQTVGVSVCYEDAFGRDIRRALPQAKWLLNVSNDAWFGRSIGPRQHLQIAHTRALETGRPMVRDTNTGRSAVIGADGALIQRLPPFRPITHEVTIQPRAGATPYARLGSLPILVTILASLAVAGLLGGLGTARRLRRAGKAFPVN